MPDAVSVMRPIRFNCWISFTQVFSYVLLSPYLCFYLILYLDLYVLGDATPIS